MAILTLDKTEFITSIFRLPILTPKSSTRVIDRSVIILFHFPTKDDISNILTILNGYDTTYNVDIYTVDLDIEIDLAKELLFTERDTKNLQTPSLWFMRGVPRVHEVFPFNRYDHTGDESTINSVNLQPYIDIINPAVDPIIDPYAGGLSKRGTNDGINKWSPKRATVPPPEYKTNTRTSKSTYLLPSTVVVGYDINGANPNPSTIELVSDTSGFTDPRFRISPISLPIETFPGDTTYVEGISPTTRAVTFQLPDFLPFKNGKFHNRTYHIRAGTAEHASFLDGGAYIEEIYDLCTIRLIKETDDPIPSYTVPIEKLGNNCPEGYDKCGVCNGNNYSCTDCNGDINGHAYIDPHYGEDSCTINACISGNTGLTGCTQDCADEWGGSAEIDECGECGGESSCVINPINIICYNEVAVSNFTFTIENVDIVSFSESKTFAQNSLRVVIKDNIITCFSLNDALKSATSTGECIGDFSGEPPDHESPCARLGGTWKTPLQDDSLILILDTIGTGAACITNLTMYDSSNNLLSTFIEDCLTIHAY